MCLITLTFIYRLQFLSLFLFKIQIVFAKLKRLYCSYRSFFLKRIRQRKVIYDVAESLRCSNYWFWVLVINDIRTIRNGRVLAANVYDPIIDESIVRHDMNYSSSIADSINDAALGLAIDHQQLVTILAMNSVTKIVQNLVIEIYYMMPLC